MSNSLGFFSDPNLEFDLIINFLLLIFLQVKIKINEPFFQLFHFDFIRLCKVY